MKAHLAVSLMVAGVAIGVEAAEPTWLRANSEFDRIRYFDGDSVKRSGDKVTFSMMADYLEAQPDGPAPHLSTLSRREADCRKRTGQILELSTYAGQAGSGKLIGVARAGKDGPSPAWGWEEASDDANGMIEPVCRWASGKAKPGDYDLYLGNDGKVHRFLQARTLKTLKNGDREANVSVTPYGAGAKIDKGSSACYLYTVRCGTQRFMRPVGGIAHAGPFCTGKWASDYYADNKAYKGMENNTADEGWEKRLAARMCSGDAPPEK